jgi:hypothetical protein
MQEIQFSVCLHISDSDLERCANTHRPIVCPISAQFELFFFPDREWTDFTVIILGWWLIQLRNLTDGSQLDVALRFMDGPYEIILTRLDASFWIALPLSRVRGAVEHGRFLVRGSQVISSICDAARTILTKCRSSGIWDKDCQALEEILQKFV